MGYIEKNLMPNEKILFTAKVNPFIFVPAVFTFVVTILFAIAIIITKDEFGKISNGMIAILFFFLTIRLGIEATVMMLTTELAITNQRIISKTGFIHQNTLEILLSKVEGINVHQNIFGRLLDFGTVTIISGITKGKFKAIIDPIGVKKKINQAVEQINQVKNTPEKK